MFAAPGVADPSSDLGEVHTRRRGDDLPLCASGACASLRASFRNLVVSGGGTAATRVYGPLGPLGRNGDDAGRDLQRKRRIVAASIGSASRDRRHPVCRAHGTGSARTTRQSGHLSSRSSHSMTHRVEPRSR